VPPVGDLDRRELLRRAAAGAAAGALLWRPGIARARPAGTPLSELASALGGDLVPRGAPGYPAAKRLHNTRYDSVRPLAVAFCESSEDVARCIGWASRNGVRVAARSGGHSYGGYSTVGGGLVVDVTRLAAVQTLAGGRAAVGSGARLGDVYTRLWESRVAIPAGSCRGVGIAGLALGGGHGYSGRKLGLTCDAVDAVTIVTAAGEIRECSETENADLLWACRGGGGGSFGIVTEFGFRTAPVSNVATYRMSWPWSRAAAAVAAWQAFAPDAPDELFSTLALRATGAGGRDLRVTSSGQFFGPAADLRALLEPLVAAGATSLTAVDRTYASAANQFAGSTARSTFAAGSAYARTSLGPAGIRVLLRAIEGRRDGRALGIGAILLNAYGGAINRMAADATAFVHRRERFSIQMVATWEPGEGPRVRDANLRWLSDLRRALRPHVSPFAYQNYIDPELADWRRAYYGSNLVRLVEVKRRYDPGNLFRFAQSIPLRA
jgi:FAD/FMN-containing dehydrogenase